MACAGLLLLLLAVSVIGIAMGTRMIAVAASVFTNNVFLNFKQSCHCMAILLSTGVYLLPYWVFVIACVITATCVTTAACVIAAACVTTARGVCRIFVMGFPSVKN